MSSRRQTLLARTNWYLQSSLNTLLNKLQVINFIKEVVVTDRFHCTRWLWDLYSSARALRHNSVGKLEAITWTNAAILLIRTLGTNLSEIISEIQIYSFKKCISNVVWKMAAILSRPQCVNIGHLGPARGGKIWITCIFDRCHRSWAAVTPAKYKRDKQQLTCVLTMLKI